MNGEEIAKCGRRLRTESKKLKKLRKKLHNAESAIEKAKDAHEVQQELVMSLQSELIARAVDDV